MARTLKPRKRKNAAIHVEPKDARKDMRPTRRAPMRVRQIEIAPQTTRDAMAAVVAIMLNEWSASD